VVIPFLSIRLPGKFRFSATTKQINKTPAVAQGAQRVLKSRDREPIRTERPTLPLSPEPGSYFSTQLSENAVAKYKHH
jgi:hypothetical protein